jgi:hypothetical protein
MKLFDGIDAASRYLCTTLTKSSSGLMWVHDPPAVNSSESRKLSALSTQGAAFAPIVVCPQQAASPPQRQ